MNKIDVYVIPPLKQMNLALLGDRLFALAQHANNNHPQYVDFFQKHSKTHFTTIDSGTAENQAVPPEELVEKAKLVDANEIICGDKLYDKNATLKLTKNTINSLSHHELKRFSLMGVPQAKTTRDFLTCTQKMLEMPEISVIGLSRFSTKKCFGCVGGKWSCFSSVKFSRTKCVNVLWQKKLVEKPFHLLGCEDPSEFFAYSGFDFIRSTDSCVSIICALHNIKFHKTKGVAVKHRPKTTKKYFSSALNKKQQRIAHHNIQILKNTCSKLTELEKGYLSGIIDGEGYVALPRLVRKDFSRGFKYYPMIQITNTSEEIIQKISRVCKGFGLVHDWGEKTNQKFLFRGWKKPHTITFNSNSLRWIVPQITQHCVKKEQLLLLRQALDLINTSPRRENQEKLEQIRLQLKQLTKRGCEKLCV